MNVTNNFCQTKDYLMQDDLPKFQCLVGLKRHVILKTLLLPTWPLEKLLCKIQDHFAIELLLLPIVLFKC